MSAKTKVFDAATYLETEEDVVAYMTEALASGDAAIVAHALGVVARARGMSRIARETGLSRESLYRALSPDGNPELATVLRIIAAMGLRLTAESAPEAA
jgi:probable addiction module antidote protein